MISQLKSLVESLPSRTKECNSDDGQNLQKDKDYDWVRQPLLKKPLLSDSMQSWRDIVIIFTALFVWLTLRCIATISSQVSGVKANIFELNSVRFGLQFLAVLPIVIIGRYSLVIARKHFCLLFGGMIFNVTCATCISVAPSFMPVGNLDALFLAFYIILSMLYDLFKGSIGWKAVVTSFFVTVGIILVAQPWDGKMKQNTLLVTPCQYLEDHMDVRVVNCTVMNDTCSTSDQANTTTIACEVKTIHFDYRTLAGYALLFVAAFGSTAAGNCVKKLLEQYPIPPLMFWLSLSEGTLCLIVNIAMTGLTGGGFYTFPVGLYCLWFTWLFIIASALGHSFSYFVYSYLYISTIAVASVYISIVLYISQRTYLRAFHPGHANIAEVSGIIVVIFGATFLPFLFAFLERRFRKA